MKEINLHLLKLFNPVLAIFLFICFFSNLSVFVPPKLPETIDKTILVVIAQFALFIAVGIYMMTISYRNKDIISLKSPSYLQSRKGDISIGKVMENNFKKHRFQLSLEDLEKHMFVCGSTGTGKSNFVQNFLINFKQKYHLPFLLVEFKGEYTYLKHYIEELEIYKPGENFSINIFNPEGSNPEIHAERIFDILKSGQFLEETSEYSPQMQKVLVEILTVVCKNKKYQSWDGFFKLSEIYLKKKERDIPMLSQTLISIKNRIRRFSVGPLKALFSSNHEFDIKKLFRKDIIIDLSSIIRLGGEKEDALFFLNMILKYLWDENLTKGAYNFEGIKHLTIVEDAQYFAPKDLTKQSKISTYLEDIALLQRGTGECLISIATRPQVSNEILANCGVLVIFKNHMEKELQCELLNLDEKNEHYLSIVKKGQCLIRTNSVKRPFVLWIPYRDRNIMKKSLISPKKMSKINDSALISDGVEVVGKSSLKKSKSSNRIGLKSMRKEHKTEDLNSNETIPQIEVPKGNNNDKRRINHQNLEKKSYIVKEKKPTKIKLTKTKQEIKNGERSLIIRESIIRDKHEASICETDKKKIPKKEKSSGKVLTKKNIIKDSDSPAKHKIIDDNLVIKEEIDQQIVEDDLLYKEYTKFERFIETLASNDESLEDDLS